jgi:hypothetical protein
VLALDRLKNAYGERFESPLLYVAAAALALAWQASPCRSLLRAGLAAVTSRSVV